MATLGVLRPLRCR